MKKKSGSSNSPVTAILAALDDLKAQNTVTLDVRGHSDMFDTLVVASGSSGRQVRALAQHVMEELKKKGFPPIGYEGLDTGEWALVDYGDTVVHVMQPEIRSFYDIESLWQAPAVPAPITTTGSKPRTSTTRKTGTTTSSTTKTAVSKTTTAKTPATKTPKAKPSTAKPAAKKTAAAKPVKPATPRSKTAAKPTTAKTTSTKTTSTKPKPTASTSSTKAPRKPTRPRNSTT